MRSAKSFSNYRRKPKSNTANSITASNAATPLWHRARQRQPGRRSQRILARRPQPTCRPQIRKPVSKNTWPKELPEFGETFSKIYSSLEMCGDIILEALTLPLELDKNFFKTMTKDGNSILRLLHYPPLPPDRDPRSIRAAAHEDINLITLLVSASASGLELKDRNGKWLPIESSPNAIIVDSGDMLARITNEVIPPPLTAWSIHRMPPPAATPCPSSCTQIQKPCSPAYPRASALAQSTLTSLPKTFSNSVYEKSAF